MSLFLAWRVDVVQLFTIDSVRLMFTGGGRIGSRGGASATTTNTPSAATSASALPPTKAFQYQIDLSTDGRSYTTVLDQTKNNIGRNTIFTEMPPTPCRFVRLTMIHWPRTTPLGIIEFTVFGKPVGSLPAPTDFRRALGVKGRAALMGVCF